MYNFTHITLQPNTSHMPFVFYWGIIFFTHMTDILYAVVQNQICNILSTAPVGMLLFVVIALRVQHSLKTLLCTFYGHKSFFTSSKSL